MANPLELIASIPLLAITTGVCPPSTGVCPPSSSDSRMAGNSGGVCPLPALVSDDVLEPSVQNEVDHALSLARSGLDATVLTNAAAMNLQRALMRELVPTSALSRTAVALRLVTSQDATGRWRVGTNDVTAAAVERLLGL